MSVQPNDKTLALVPKQYLKALPENEVRALGAWLSTFYPFQRDWLLDTAESAINNKARQIGQSHTTSGVGALWGAFHGELTTIISVGDRESVEVLDKAKKHVRVLQRLGSKMASLVKETSSEISFRSGGRVMALPSSAGRGFTGNVFLDEYGYQEHAEEIWDSAAAVTLLGGRLRVVSTPNGVGNEFYRLWRLANQPNSGWSAHQTTIEQAIAQGYPVDIKKCWRIAKNDPRLFAQLFQCSFLDSEFQYIPNALIEASRVPSTWCDGGECYAGLDIGRTNDLTSLVIIKKDAQGILWRQHVETRKRTQFEDLEALAAVAFGAPFFARKLSVDATGLGSFPAEMLQKRFGRSRVDPITFTLQSKEVLATTLHQAFVDNRIRLLDTEEDRAICEDVASIRRIVTSAGNVRYDAPHTDEGHADRAWALALAVHGCSRPGARRVEINDYSDPGNYE